MEIGLGLLGYSEDEFWSMTVRGFTAAVVGFKEKNGIRKPGSANLTPGDIDRLQSLMASEA